MNRALVIVGTIAILGLGGLWLALRNPTPKATTPTLQDRSSESSTSADETTPAVEEESAATTVTIKDFAYSPTTLTIKKGTTVTWTNQDSTAHTVTSDSGGELDSDTLDQGESFLHTFNTVGTFDYHCAPHPQMKATVIVE